MNAKKEIFHDKPAIYAEGDFYLPVEVLFAGETQSRATEVLWCKKISESIVKLCCIPFLLSTYSLGDIVEVETDGSKNRIIKVLESSHIVTFRLWSTNPERADFSDIQRILGEITHYQEELPSHKVFAFGIEASNEIYVKNLIEYEKKRSRDFDYNRTLSEHQIDYKIHYHPVWKKIADSIINASVENEAKRTVYESLWAKKNQDGLYEICCIPYFIYDLALGDIIEADLDERGKLLYKKVFQHSGNKTIWVQFNNAKRDDLNRVLEKVIKFDCLYEGYNERFLAFNANSDEQLTSVISSLSNEIKIGLIEYSSNRSDV